MSGWTFDASADVPAGISVGCGEAVIVVDPMEKADAASLRGYRTYAHPEA